MLPLQARVDLGVMAMKRNSAFSKASSDCLKLYLGHSLEESYPSAEIQLVYSAAPAEWAKYQTKMTAYLQMMQERKPCFVCVRKNETHGIVRKELFFIS